MSDVKLLVCMECDPDDQFIVPGDFIGIALMHEHLKYDHDRPIQDVPGKPDLGL